MDSAIANFVIPILLDIQRTRFSDGVITVSSSSIIVFDYLITLDEEVEYIWKRRWSIGKVLFLLNRYYSLFTVGFNNYAMFYLTAPNSFCTAWFKWQGWTGLAMCVLAEIILQLRIYALYQRSRKIAIFLLVTFVCVFASSAAIMGNVLSHISASVHLLPGIQFCIPLGAPSHFYAFWIPILVFETILCGLALFRGYRSYITQVSPSLSFGTTVYEILIRDSILYFLVMFATYLTTSMIWIAGSAFVLEIPIGFAVAMSCVMGNRLLLNLRRTSESTPESLNGLESLDGDTYHVDFLSLGETDYVIGISSGHELKTLRDLRAESYPY